MNICEAMKLSKKTGQSFSGGPNYSGWLKYDANWQYHDLSAEDLMSDDWEMHGDAHIEKEPELCS